MNMSKVEPMKDYELSLDDETKTFILDTQANILKESIESFSTNIKNYHKDIISRKGKDDGEVDKLLSKLNELNDAISYYYTSFTVNRV